MSEIGQELNCTGQLSSSISLVLIFVEAVAQDQSPFNLVTSIDYDINLREASRGRSFLAVRPASYAQLKQIRDLLAPHRAYLAKYIDTWTLTELLP